MGQRKIGILVNNLTEFAHPACRGTVYAGEELGYDVKIFCMPPMIGEEVADRVNLDIDENSFLLLLSFIEGFNLSGLVVMTDVADFIPEGLMDDFIADNPNLPVVTIAAQVEGASLIVSDNYASSLEAVEHMIMEHGCKKIAYIQGPEHNQEAWDRFQGYVDALKKHNLTLDHRLIHPGDWFFPCGRAAIRRMLDEYKIRPDAIVGANDNMVAGALDELSSRGIKAPDHIFAMGFDNSNYAESYGFSSVSQSFSNLAKRAVELIDRQIIKNDFTPEVYKQVASLVIRRGCGCELTRKNFDLVCFDSDNLRPEIHHINQFIESLEYETFTHKKIMMKALLSR